MLFMVMSTPRPERPSEVRSAQTAFWDWLEPLRATGVVKDIYVKAGRGLFIVFDVDSHEILHRYMSDWADRVPAAMQVWPLIDPAVQEGIAREGAQKR
jgi:hypothetical protein